MIEELKLIMTALGSVGESAFIAGMTWMVLQSLVPVSIWVIVSITVLKLANIVSKAMGSQNIQNVIRVKDLK